jgi:hypothetical protein
MHQIRVLSKLMRKMPKTVKKSDKMLMQACMKAKYPSSQARQLHCAADPAFVPYLFPNYYDQLLSLQGQLLVEYHSQRALDKMDLIKDSSGYLLLHL